ncbi:MAG: hypothetical protein GEV10_15270 [Streptosporangiales bacterium]|nr:hypothetical protein [Streptosporangiales bacterium]
MMSENTQNVKLSRRRVLQLAGATAALPLSQGLVGCVGAPAEQGKGGGGGGKLIVCMSESPSTLDPAFAIDRPEYSVTSWVYDNLVRLDHELNVKPSLALEWTSNKQADVWKFRLRKDARFTNGRRVVSDDVAFSLRRLLDKKVASPGRTELAVIERVEIPDNETVVLRLIGPYAELPALMATKWARIVAKEGVKDLKTKPLGSGPYEFDEYVPQSHVSVRVRDDYWDSEAGRMKEIFQRTIPDNVAQLNALESGDVHIVADVPVEFYDRVNDGEGLRIEQSSAAQWFPMVMRVDKEPFDDPLVREALKWCIDRQELIDGPLDGHGVLGNDQPVPPSSEYYADIKPKEQDIGRAKQLLAKAGLPDGFTHTIVASTDTPLRADVAVAITQMVKKAGITFKVKTVDPNTYLNRVYKKGSLYIGQWGQAYPLDSLLTPHFASDASLNEYRYREKKLDKALMAARAAVDDQRRKELYGDVQSIIGGEGPIVIPFFTRRFSGVRSGVKGYEASALLNFDLRYVDLR